MIHASILVAALALAPAAASAASVEITVIGAQKSGKILGQVFADAASFKARERPVLRFAIDPKGASTVRDTLTLPPGRYAIALFQDVKGTGKLETNLFGAPVVPYGFSNDARGTMGPPGFEAAAITVGSESQSFAIRLQ